MEIFGFDAFSPQQIAQKVGASGVTKARLPLLALVMLGIAAGGFVGLGALYSTIMLSDPTLPFAASRLLAGLAFSLGLILVVIAGAELFTGSNLLVMAWADRRISSDELLRNWIGLLCQRRRRDQAGSDCVSVHHGDLNHGATANEDCRGEDGGAFWEAFFKGVLCNLLVCLGVWLAMAGRSAPTRCSPSCFLFPRSSPRFPSTAWPACISFPGICFPAKRHPHCLLGC